jgi:hypothetical protein
MAVNSQHKAVALEQPASPPNHVRFRLTRDIKLDSSEGVAATKKPRVLAALGGNS